MKRRKKRGKTAGVKKAKRIVRKKRAAKRTGAVVSMPEAVQAPAAPPVEKIPYVAPKRAHINDAVCALLPHIDPKLIKKLDYWALYTIHQDVVKSGKDAETLARSLIKGYDPAKAFPVSPAQSAAAVTAKEQERMMRAKEIENRKVDAKKRELAARERARVAKELARAKAQAAKDRERAARAAARAKRSSPIPRPVVAAPAAKTAPAPAAPVAPVKRGPASAYIAPVRARIREELAKVMPMIKQSDLSGLDYWALYTMHSRICKYGDDPESMARKFVKGYKKVKK
ncbi:MAG: hypothetical protein WCP22_00915 [Chlamydiota bacterium]